MIPLNQLQIPTPCHEDWDAMTGDSRRRACAGCGCHVHNLSAMTRAEAQSMLNQTEARVCVRFHVSPEGLPLTLDEIAPVDIPRPRFQTRRLAAAVSWLMALSLTALGAVARAASDTLPSTHAKVKPSATAPVKPRRHALMGKIAVPSRKPPVAPPHVLMGAPTPVAPTMGMVGPTRPSVPPKR